MIVHCCIWITRHVFLQSRWPRFHFSSMSSEVNVGFTSSFHTLPSRHFITQESHHFASTSPMHGGSVALVGIN